MSENAVEKTTQLLEKWQRKCRINQRGHSTSASRLTYRNQLIGVPAVLLAAALGSGLLSTAQMQLGIPWRIAAGFAGIGTAILTAFHLSANYHGLAERHRLASIRFDALYREIDQFLAAPPATEDLALQAVDRMRKDLDSLFEQAPVLGPKLLDERRSLVHADEGRTRKFEDLPFNMTSSR